MRKKAEFSNIFLKRLKSTDTILKEKIKIKIKQILLDPEIGIPLKGNLKPMWKLKIGKLRIIYKFDNEKVYFVALDLRKRVYKK